jgi:hypothetical protein
MKPEVSLLWKAGRDRISPVPPLTVLAGVMNSPTSPLATRAGGEQISPLPHPSCVDRAVPLYIHVMLLLFCSHHHARALLKTAPDSTHSTYKGTLDSTSISGMRGSSK